MLYLIGLGLYDEKDITWRGVDAARSCEAVYLERYTSPWRGSVEKLERLIGKSIAELRRSDLEENSKELLGEAKKRDIAVLVPGDPLVATTHASLIIDARKRGIKTAVVHSSSVFSAVAETGLHIYKFGKTTTIAYPEENYSPESPYKVLEENLKIGAHTLFLLDVKADQGKYMTVREGIDILLKLEKKGKKVFGPKTMCVGVARLGGKTKIVFKPAGELQKEDMGDPPHILIVPGELHFSEEEYLRGLMR
jgi:diphthine synthase